MSSHMINHSKEDATPFYGSGYLVFAQKCSWFIPVGEQKKKKSKL